MLPCIDVYCSFEPSLINFGWVFASEGVLLVRQKVISDDFNSKHFDNHFPLLRSFPSKKYITSDFFLFVVM